MQIQQEILKKFMPKSNDGLTVPLSQVELEDSLAPPQHKTGSNVKKSTASFGKEDK